MEPIARLSRLSAILTMLKSNALVNATQLSNKFGVSIRTIYRDIRALESSGVPIYVEEGRGYKLMDGYTLPPIMFTEQEANALITAQQIISQNKDKSLIENYSNAITKIKSVLRTENREKAALLEERIAYIKNINKHVSSDNLMKIQSALTNHYVLELTYTALYDGNTTQRNVEPMAIYHTQDNWIMVAWCRLRSDFRDFRLDRINALIERSHHFTPREFDLIAYFKRGLQQ
ncbi:MAG: YafY family protein [Saprospiraceae bacterium]|nr:YafY family protein [Saprospiraceae bacterium]